MRTLSAVFTLALTAPSFAQEGVTLYQGFTSMTTQLIDGTGATVHDWSATAGPGLSVYLQPNGDLIRTRAVSSGVAGAGGGVERVTFDGTVLWQWELIDPNLIPHHDVTVLPNGNVLVLVAETHGDTAAIAQGRDPSTAGPVFMAERIIELQPTGSTATIVWEWNAWDHMVQDFDSNLPNFGVVADHPELFDLNYPPVLTSDWLHFNGLDYNEELDQLAFSSPTLNEIWIIDHSTTTAEAAGHTGGNSGKGGDILYRWGNPQAYDRGTEADRRLWGVHDIQWIPRDRPGAGNLLMLNNGNGRPGGDFSSVDEIIPPVDLLGNYAIGAGVAFGPTSLEWTYDDPGTFFSPIMSGCQRLTNGNTLVIQSTAGRIFEVTEAGAITFDYTHTAMGNNWVFKARRYHETITGVDYCFGDGGFDPGCTSCPCGNDATAGTRAGCLNAAGSAARLVASGRPSTSNDSLRMELEGGNPSTFGVLISADNRLPAVGSNPCFGLDSGVTSVSLDGLRCVGGNVLRHGSRAIDANGAIGQTTPGWGLPDGPSGGLIANGAFSTGQTRNFQVFYREDDQLSCGRGQNTSNGFGLTFLP